MVSLTDRSHRLNLRSLLRPCFAVVVYNELSYKPTSSWRIFSWSGLYSMQFSILKTFRSVVSPGGCCHKGVVLQGRQLKRRFSCGSPLVLDKKRGITGASVHAPIHRNSTYLHTFRRSIYKTRWPEHPHLPICRYQQCPQGPSSRTRHRWDFSLKW